MHLQKDIVTRSTTRTCPNIWYRRDICPRCAKRVAEQCSMKTPRKQLKILIGSMIEFKRCDVWVFVGGFRRVFARAGWTFRADCFYLWEIGQAKCVRFGKEDTAKELQDHAADTQDTLVDAVENAEVRSTLQLSTPNTRKPPCDVRIISVEICFSIILLEHHICRA